MFVNGYLGREWDVFLRLGNCIMLHYLRPEKRELVLEIVPGRRGDSVGGELGLAVFH
jgi:hypothetical protein